MERRLGKESAFNQKLFEFEKESAFRQKLFEFEMQGMILEKAREKFQH